MKDNRVEHAIEIILKQEYGDGVNVEYDVNNKYQVNGYIFFETLDKGINDIDLTINISDEYIKEGESIRDTIIRQIDQYKEEVEDIYFAFDRKKEIKAKQYQNTGFTLKLKSAINGETGAPHIYSANQFPRRSGISSSLKVLAQEYDVPIVYPNKEQLKVSTKDTEVEAWTIHEALTNQGHNYPFVLSDMLHAEDIELLLNNGYEVYGVHR